MVWSYQASTKQIRLKGGLCLDASQRNKPGGLVHMFECDPDNPNQHWEYDASHKQIKATFGTCLDSPQREFEGGMLRMMTCNRNDINQMWDLKQAPQFQNIMVKVRGGLCLAAPSKHQRGAAVYFVECDTEGPDPLLWAFNAVHKQLMLKRPTKQRWVQLEHPVKFHAAE